MIKIFIYEAKCMYYIFAIWHLIDFSETRAQCLICNVIFFTYHRWSLYFIIIIIIISLLSLYLRNYTLYKGDINLGKVLLLIKCVVQTWTGTSWENHGLSISNSELYGNFEIKTLCLQNLEISDLTKKKKKRKKSSCVVGLGFVILASCN